MNLLALLIVVAISLLVSLIVSLYIAPKLTSEGKVKEGINQVEKVTKEVNLDDWQEWVTQEYLYHPNPDIRELLNEFKFPDEFIRIVKKEMQYGFRSLSHKEKTYLKNKIKDIGYWSGLKTAINTPEMKKLRKEARDKLNQIDKEDNNEYTNKNQ